MSPLPRTCLLRRAPRRARGLTLIELAIVLAIVAVLIGTGARPLTAAVDSIRLSAIANDFQGQMQFARSEAIKRRARVAMCKSADGLTCATTGGWEQGWIVFNDADNDARRDLAETILHRGEPLPAGFLMRGNQLVNRYLSFTSLGGTKTLAGQFQAGAVTVCKLGFERTQGREVVVSANGRPRAQKVELDACF